MMVTHNELHELRRNLWKEGRKMPNQSGTFSKPDSQGMMFAGFGQHRDSEPLEQANFEAAKRALAQFHPVVLSFGHWAVGWTESLFVPATIAAVQKIAELQKRLESYPVLDEDLLSEYEEDAGGLCSNCGETGHHDCSQCRSHDDYEKHEDQNGHEVCFYCGESESDHSVKCPRCGKETTFGAVEAYAGAACDSCYEGEG